MRRSLRTKWTAVVLFIGVAPLVISALVVQRIQRDGLFRAEQELENAVVDEASRSLARSLTEGEDAVHRAALVLGDARIEEGARLDLAREAVNDAEIVRSAAIFAADGSVIGAIEKRGEASPAPRAPLPADGGRERRPHWVWSRAPSGEPTLEFLEPVVVDGAVTAWVLGEMRPEVLTKRVVELSRSRFGREDRLVVIDRELRVVAGDSARWPAGRSLADQPLVLASRLDAAAFTTFAEGATPEQVVTLLNELFTVLSEVVFRHGGMVDKFMGDCIMAVFGTREDAGGDHVASALAAAEDMHRFVEASAAHWKREFDYDVELGIGLATGEALVGNLGSEARMEFTAVGDVVNVASRLETLARPGQTLVTAAVAAGAGERFEFHSLGLHPLRGKAHSVEVLEVLA